MQENMDQSKKTYLSYRAPGKPSEYLLCKQELKHCNTGSDVKFSEAIISSPCNCRFFSFFIKSNNSGSESQTFEFNNSIDIFLGCGVE